MEHWLGLKYIGFGKTQGEREGTPGRQDSTKTDLVGTQ